MAITKEVNIQMLEKLADGNYKKKNPETKASQVKFNDGSNVEQKKADWDAKPDTQRAVSNSVTSTSSTTAASSKAVKTAYDKGAAALSKANGNSTQMAELAKDLVAESAKINKLVKVKQNIVISPASWRDDTANSGFWVCYINDADITTDTVVDVNIHLADLEKAKNLKSANLSSTSKVTIFADEQPVENIVADLKLIRQVN